MCGENGKLCASIKWMHFIVVLSIKHVHAPLFIATFRVNLVCQLPLNVSYPVLSIYRLRPQTS